MLKKYLQKSAIKKFQVNQKVKKTNKLSQFKLKNSPKLFYVLKLKLFVVS